MKSIGLAFIFITLLSTSSVLGQANRIQGEYIESSSPLRNGGNVTTRAEPGRRVQTTVTVAALPSTPASTVNARSGPSQLGNGTTPTNSGASSTLNSQAVGQGGAQSVLNTGGATSDNTVDNRNQTANTSSYPYPANYPPNFQRVPASQTTYQANNYQNGPAARTAGLFNNQFGAYSANAVNGNQQVNAARAQYQNNCNCAPSPVNGLGLTAPPNYGAVPNYNQLPQLGFQQRGLVGAGVQPVLSQAPQAPVIQYQTPGQANYNVGQAGGGQFGAFPQQPFGTRSPWFSGSPGAYQPLFRMFNMPQESFLGQGIVGQPEAYVNGQPVINFFRYLFPF